MIISKKPEIDETDATKKLFSSSSSFRESLISSKNWHDAYCLMSGLRVDLISFLVAFGIDNPLFPNHDVDVYWSDMRFNECFKCVDRIMHTLRSLIVIDVEQIDNDTVQSCLENMEHSCVELIAEIDYYRRCYLYGGVADDGFEWALADCFSAIDRLCRWGIPLLKIIQKQNRREWRRSRNE